MADPRQFACTEALRNGLTITIRALRPDDRERIAAAFRELDKESVYTRLFTYKRELTDAELTRIVSVDPGREVALLATVGSGTEEKVIGSGRYVVAGGEGAGRTAEVAFIVEEDYQGLGIASRLLACLAALARQQGIAAFEADVLSGNKGMLAVFAHSGLPMRQRREDGGVIHVTLTL